MTFNPEDLPEPTEVITFRPDDRVLLTFPMITAKQAAEIKARFEAVFPDIKFAILSGSPQVTVLREEDQGQAEITEPSYAYCEKCGGPCTYEGPLDD